MKYLKIISIFFLTIFIHSLCIAQDTDTIEEEAENPDLIYYKIITRIPVNVAHKYIYKENSEITRTFSDGSTKKYERELIYHFTFVAPSPVDKDGFQTVNVSVDSLEYQFKDKDTTIYFNDQADDLRPPKISDFNINLVPLGLNFEMTYNPYDEVAKVGGEMLLEKRKYVSDPNTAPSDELVRFTWVNGLKDEALNTIFDVFKGITPFEQVAIDSSYWDKEIFSKVEGAYFIDSVEFWLSKFNIQYFTIKGKSDSFKPLNNKVRLFDINQLTELSDVSGTSEYTIKMHPRGSLNELDIKYDLELKYQILGDVVTQKVKTHKNWFLDKMYNW